MVGLVNNLNFLEAYLEKEALKFSLLENLLNSIGTNSEPVLL